ncbi:uncharacterized protein METZ01_LOCUS113359 [marine metagenome]|uniref:Uncharacterized protein n=1 Tax=marine metagenome TaxID=408172 RepID=A0A381X6W9_9ZZZZ
MQRLTRLHFSPRGTLCTSADSNFQSTLALAAFQERSHGTDVGAAPGS